MNEKLKIRIKLISVIISVFCVSPAFSLSLSELVEFALQNNSDIATAQSDYDSALLSSRTYNGSFAPGLSFSSSSTFPKEYDWNTNPDYFSTFVTYTQPLPGGTTVSATGTYSFNSATAMDGRYLSQSPGISFTLTQSLRPFWTQGTIQDPTILSAKQQAKYYYLQLKYVEKTVLQNMIQNYAYVLFYKNEIQIYKNLISLVEEQIEALQELKFSGNTNQTKITELESTKWGYEEDLMSVQASYYSYLQNLKVICGCEIDDIENSLAEPEDSIFDEVFSTDPMDSIYQLKLEMLKTDRILQKQNSAPTLDLTLQPVWTLDTVKNSDWKGAWTNNEKPSWSVSVSINLSPLLNDEINRTEERYELSYEQAVNNYEKYLFQKQYVLEQYQLLVQSYTVQLENVTKLYEEGKVELEDYNKQYEAGAISRLDFDSVKIRVENCGLSRSCVEIYKWMYELLGRML